MRIDTRGSRNDLELHERVARIEDTEAIRTLWAHYAYLADTEDSGDSISQLHVEDAVWAAEGPGDFGRFVGRDSIKGFFDDLYAVSPFRHHAMTNDYLDLADDRRTATGRWKLTDLCTMGATDGTAMLLLGNYESEFVATDSGWKIRSVALTTSVWAPWTAGWTS